MKVALVHLRHSQTGGTERYLNQIAAHLAERGDEVTVICRSHEDAPHPGVRFVVLRRPVPGSTWRMWAFARDVERHVTAGGYDVVFGLGKTWTHDVVRLGGGCHQTYLDLAAARTGLARRLAPLRFKQRVALSIEARALATARVITNSQMVKRDVMDRYSLAADRIDVVYNGVDLDRFHPRKHRERAAELRRACGFGGDDFVVLFLGSAYRRKGLDLLLTAFAQRAAHDARARLLVVGYDSAQPRYERTAAQLGIGERTRFLGGRRDAEVCFAAADLYVLPTLYDPFANSTLEALATGLPVITTTANGSHEILTPDETGSVLRAGDDAAALCAEIAAWSGRQGGAEKARRLAETFPQERTARDSAAVLDRAAAEKRRVSR